MTNDCAVSLWRSTALPCDGVRVALHTKNNNTVTQASDPDMDGLKLALAMERFPAKYGQEVLARFSEPSASLAPSTTCAIVARRPFVLFTNARPTDTPVALTIVRAELAYPSWATADTAAESRPNAS